MADTLLVSRHKIATALSALAREGAVERRRRLGTFATAHGETGNITLGVGFRKPAHRRRPHFLALTEALSEQAKAAGVGLRFFEGIETMFSGPDEANPVSRAIAGREIFGMIAATRTPLGVLAEMRARAPVAVVNNDYAVAEVPSFSCDMVQVGATAAMFFADRGHRKIGFIADGLAHPQARQMLGGYRIAAQAAKLDFSDDAILIAPANEDSFQARIKAFFAKTDRTAFLARDDFIAARVIRQLGREGRRVPEDISILGVGAYASGYSLDIRLSTIDTRFGDMCAGAVNYLAALARGRQAPTIIKEEFGVLLTPRPIEGQTTKEMKRNAS